MKSLIAVVLLAFTASIFAAEPAKKEEKKAEVNCVTKDKKGNCPTPPKTQKPTPKKKDAAPVATPAVTKADAPPAKK
jgi:hypothetical protein